MSDIKISTVQHVETPATKLAEGDLEQVFGIKFEAEPSIEAEQEEASSTPELAPKEPRTQDTVPEAQVEKEEAPPAPEPEAEPEPKAEEVRPPLTKFVAKDEQGEVDANVLRFDFKAAGKEYKDVPLEKVVLLAQMGVANQEREAQVLAAKKFVAESQQEHAQLTELVHAYDEHVQRLFTDPTYFELAREEWAVQNSPERRAQKAEKQLEASQVQQAQAQADSIRRSFVEQVLAPRVSSILEQYPSISEEALVGRYTMLTAPLLVRGAVPVNRLGEVQRLVEQDLAQWAKEQNTLHELETSKASTKSKAQTTAAQVQATLAKRTLAKAVAPTAASSPPGQEKPKKVEYNSVDDWLKSVMPTQAD